MGAWLEGNAVVAPNGQLVDVLRVQTRSPDEKAAIIHLSDDGKTASFDPAKGFVRFPGGAHNNHDSNFLTFHRFANFRSKTMSDSVAMPSTE